MSSLSWKVPGWKSTIQKQNIGLLCSAAAPQAPAFGIC